MNGTGSGRPASFSAIFVIQSGSRAVSSRYRRLAVQSINETMPHPPGAPLYTAADQAGLVAIRRTEDASQKVINTLQPALSRLEAEPWQANVVINGQHA